MTQTVYVDLFFLVNFSMDFLCLYLTARILHRRVRMGRMLTGAALGGLYANVALFLPLSSMGALAIDVLACLLLCAVALWEGKRTGFWRVATVFVAISAALGGTMTALFYLLNRTPLASLTVADGDGLSIWIFALLALLSGVITLLGGRLLGRHSKACAVELEILYGGRTLRLHALVDSGNLLCEPMSGRPCIVADVDALEGLLPCELLLAARRGDAMGLGRIGQRHAARLRIIPTHTATGEQLLLGVRADRVTVDCGDEAREVDAWIALGRLGASADGYEALLPSVLLIS